MTGWWVAGVGLAVVLLGGWLLLFRKPRAAVPTDLTPADRALTPRAYSPKNVGNDASARPWEQSTLDKEKTERPAQVPATQPVATDVPAGFDAAVFLRDAREQFLALQAAWDRADVSTVRSWLTPTMLEQIEQQLKQREQAHASASPAEVVMLDAQLIGLEATPQAWVASVEFSGLIREEASAGPNPFRELWNISQARDDDGRWRVAGVQSLQ